MHADSEAQFARTVHETIMEAQQLGYNASIFRRMVAAHGPVEAARRLVTSIEASDGFTKLWELRRLDLTMEAKVLRPEFAALFAPEARRRARERLREYGFDA